jgi:hypothetical protein
MPIINLGQAGSLFIGMTAPSNIKMLWYDDNAGQKRLKYYDNGATNWLPLTSAISSATLQNELNVIGVTVGSVSDGDSWPAGTSIEEVLRQILSKVGRPTYSAPVGSLSISPDTTIYEAGVNANISVSPTFTPNDSGGLSGYSLLKNSIELSTNFVSYLDNIDIVLGNNLRHSAIMSYSEGDTKYDNDVPPVLDPTGKILAGSLNPYAPQIVGVFPWFYGVSDDNSISAGDIYAGNKIVQATPDTLVLGSGFGVGNKYLWFAVPRTYGKTFGNWWKTTLNNGTIGGGTNLFGAPTIVNVTSTGLATNWVSEPYDLYVSNYITGANGYTEIRP